MPGSLAALRGRCSCRLHGERGSGTNDSDGLGNLCDPCPNDALNDADNDGVCGDVDGCPNDSNKIDSGQCGCNVPDTDTDEDGVADCIDLCPGFDDNMHSDADGIPDGCDNCPEHDNPDPLDDDGDGVGNACDACLTVNDARVSTGANDVDLWGTFSPVASVDLSVDDVVYTLDDGAGHALTVTVPAGSFEPSGKPEEQKFRFDTPKGSVPDIKAEFDFNLCEFKLDAKHVSGTNEIVGTTLTVTVQVGANVGQEGLEMENKGNHREHKKHPKVSCCPN